MFYSWRLAVRYYYLDLCSRQNFLCTYQRRRLYSSMSIHGLSHWVSYTRCYFDIIQAHNNQNPVQS